MTTDQMLLEHLVIIAQALEKLKEGVEHGLTFPPDGEGVLIHRENTLGIIQVIGTSVWACTDLIKYRDDDGEEKRKEQTH